MARFKVFCERGASGMWIGPLLLLGIWFLLKKMNVISYISVKYFMIAVIGMIVMSFIACGSTVLYQMKTLPKLLAVLLHLLIVFLEFVIIYVCNEWMHTDHFSYFAMFFIPVFFIFWMMVFLWTKYWKEIVQK